MLTDVLSAGVVLVVVVDDGSESELTDFPPFSDCILIGELVVDDETWNISDNYAMEKSNKIKFYYSFYLLVLYLSINLLDLTFH